MDKAKRLYRQLFLYLLTAIAAAFTAYSGLALRRVEKTLASREFIDTALESVSKAYALMQRRDTLELMLRYGVIALAVCIVLVLTLHLSRYLAKRKTQPKKPKPQRTPAAAPGAFCTACGAPLPQGKPFCPKCGAKVL